MSLPGECPYDFEVSRICNVIRRCHARTVLFQAPDGLKAYLPSVLDFVRDEVGDVDIIISSSHAYGSCDVCFQEALTVRADLIFHFGHLKHWRVKFEPVKTVYIPCFRRLLEVDDILDNIISFVSEKGFRRISLSCSIQYYPVLKRLHKALVNKGFRVFPKRITPENTYVLGCYYNNVLLWDSHVDAHLLLSSGTFHGLGLKIKSKAKVLCFDVERNCFLDVDSIYRRVLGRKLHTLMQAFEAKSFGILVSLKPGQYNMKSASACVKLLRSRGFRANIVLVDNITPDIIDNLPYDAYINTACPRVSIDDIEVFRKNVISLSDVRYLLKGSLRDYRLEIKFDFE